ncbi:VOC family protein [Stutzerimonas zhaodongensis]|jgi:catechol 2,3-dioxygenase-like lactoylglutathione lyase family enzyme|uniref:VOC family protein n=1 Tax=Stutzerimonas zhaodongensis TaxID=1176257 RepID=A0A365PPB2_9GAMM|nr:VOC family protein [Stutzerimonas zhaodongensis]QWV17029.1 VOC family protein [Stutzerimonas zhaodongensis]RBA51216.1 VOC family protein [Stutzerimonas zhaodongensis]
MSEFAGSAIDHMGIGVSDILHARDFYEQALKPLGITLMMSIETDPPQSTPRRLGFGSAGKPFLWLHHAPVPSHGAHIALIAQTHEEVDAFHAAAIAAGGKDNGAPGIRPRYHANYYAAYVLGPDGVNLEAVCQLATRAPWPA